MTVTKRRIGKTGIEVTPIGLGAMQFSGGKRYFRFVLNALPVETQNEIIKAALDIGMNWVDTAEIYGAGASERAVAEALSVNDQNPGDMLIATKWFPLFRRAKSIRNAVRKSMGRLRPFPIDLYQIHWPYSLSSIKAQMDVMADLVDAKVIRGVGVSNFSQDKMIKAHEALSDRGIPLASNQVRVNLLDRRIETNGVLESAKDLGVTIIAYTPLSQGILSGKLHKNPQLLRNMPFVRRRSLRRYMKKSQPLVDELETIALEQEATPAQVALNWLINFYGDNVVAIPGASKPTQAMQNGQAMNLQLSSEVMKTIDSISVEFTIN